MVVAVAVAMVVVEIVLAVEGSSSRGTALRVAVRVRVRVVVLRRVDAHTAAAAVAARIAPVVAVVALLGLLEAGGRVPAVRVEPLQPHTRQHRAVGGDMKGVECEFVCHWRQAWTGWKGQD